MSAEAPKNPVQLKVLEAYTRDVGRGVARIDYDSMDAINVSTGDVVRIQGSKRTTVAKVLPLYPSDEGRGVIRIDGLIRDNAGVPINEMVTVIKVKTPPAEKVTIEASEAVPPINEKYFADALESVPIQKGDKVMIPYFGGRLTFTVKSFDPESAEQVVVTQRTAFTIEGERLPPKKKVRKVKQVAYARLEEKVNELLNLGFEVDRFVIVRDEIVAIMKKTSEEEMP